MAVRLWLFLLRLRLRRRVLARVVVGGADVRPGLRGVGLDWGGRIEDGTAARPNKKSLKICLCSYNV